MINWRKNDNLAQKRARTMKFLQKKWRLLLNNDNLAQKMIIWHKKNHKMTGNKRKMYSICTKTSINMTRTNLLFEKKILTLINKTNYFDKWFYLIKTDRDFKNFKRFYRKSQKNTSIRPSDTIDYAVFLYRILKIKLHKERYLLFRILYMCCFFDTIKPCLLEAICKDLDTLVMSNLMNFLIYIGFWKSYENSLAFVKCKDWLIMYLKETNLYDQTLSLLFELLKFRYYPRNVETHIYLSKVFAKIWILGRNNRDLVDQYCDAVDVMGKNCLHYYATQKNCTTIVKYILSKGSVQIDKVANVESVPQIFHNLKTVDDDEYEFGFTPLHLAIIYGNRPIVKLLNKYNARTDIVDKYGKTADYWSKLFH